jgi:hypothetical protein
MILSLPFVLKTQVGASSDCVDGPKGWEIGALMGSLDFVVEVGVGYLVLFLVELVGCSLWDMLFARVP